MERVPECDWPLWQRKLAERLALMRRAKAGGYETVAMSENVEFALDHPRLLAPLKD